MNNFFIILDIETTGLSHINNDIIEIGAIKIDKTTLKIVDEFEILININSNVPIFITNLTGITKQMLNNKGVSLNRALNLLTKFCSTSLIFAHNASFDKRFIRHNLHQEGIIYDEAEWRDTIKIFKQRWPNAKNYKLNSLITEHNLALKEDHRALSDVKHTFTLLKMCI